METPASSAGRPGAGPGRKTVTAKDAALRFVSYRPRSESEVRRYLVQRFPEAEVEPAIGALRSLGYLDDAAFARLWRQSRERRRPRGERLLKEELARLGVARETIDETLLGFDEEHNAYRAGQQFAHRRSALAQPEPVFRRRLWAYLQRRGFRGSAARAAVDRLWQELLELPADSLDGQEYPEDD